MPRKFVFYIYVTWYILKLYISVYLDSFDLYYNDSFIKIVTSITESLLQNRRTAKIFLYIYIFYFSFFNRTPRINIARLYRCFIQLESFSSSRLAHTSFKKV